MAAVDLLVQESGKRRACFSVPGLGSWKRRLDSVLSCNGN